jgi:hypothetical protein
MMSPGLFGFFFAPVISSGNNIQKLAILSQGRCLWYLSCLLSSKENITISAASLEKAHARNLQILNIGHLVFKNFSPVLKCQIAGTRF